VGEVEERDGRTLREHAHPLRGLRRGGVVGGEVDWLILGLLVDGRRFEVVYDHPFGDDRNTVLIVSVWDF
jgi:hypothetical protein